MSTFTRFLLSLLALGLPGSLTWAQPPADPPPANLADAPQFALAESYETGSEVNGRTGLIAGVGLYVIQPCFENNPAYNLLTETATNDVTTGVTADRVNVSHHMQAAPLFWLGYLGEDGLGGRARYWYFRQGTDQTVQLPPFTGDYDVDPDGNVILHNGTLQTVTSATPQGLQAFGDTLSRDFGPQSTIFNVQTKLEVQVFDLEVCQVFRPGPWDILASGGIRLVRLAQTYNVYERESSGPLEFRTLLSSYDFEGVGPVIAVELRRGLGDSGFSFISSARGAFVMGSVEQDARFGGLRLRNEDPNPQIASQHWDRGLPIAELELGLEYAQNVGAAQFFAQATLVGQEWFSAGNASRSAGLSPPHSPNPVLGGAPVDSNLAFLGCAFRLGWNY